MSKLLITSVNEQIPKLSNSEGIDENSEIHFTFFFFLLGSLKIQGTIC